MKKAILLLWAFVFSLDGFGQMNITASSATSVTDGINVNLQTYCATVPHYLGYTYTIVENQINIAVCYYITILLMETASNHDMFIPIADTSVPYTINLTLYSSLSEPQCDYNAAINNTSYPLANPDFNLTTDNIKIVPNPSHGEVTIAIENQTVPSVKWYNAMGQLVKTTTQSDISLMDLKDGVYLLSIATENGNVFKKIILQKQ